MCPTQLLVFSFFFFSFFFNDTATTEIYTLSLHDALPIYLPIKQITRATDQTITVEFKNGGVYVLSGAYVIGEPASKGDDGTIDIQWDGTKGVWQ